MKRIGLVAVIVALMAALFIPTGLVYAQDIYLWPASDWAEIEFDGYFDGYADYDVTLFWDYDTDDEAILATTPTTVTTDDGGYFEGSFVIPAAATTGAHTVTAMIDYVEGEMYSNDAVVMVLTGPAGEDGSDGATGQQGDTGPAGSEGPAGSAGPEGPAGPAGPEGPAGPQGEQGPQGEPGPAGESSGAMGITAIIVALAALVLSALQWIKKLVVG